MFWSPWWASLERDKTFDVLLQDALDRFMTLMTAVIIVKLVVHTTHSTSWYFRSFDRILTDNERQANFKTFHQTDENISKLLFSSSFEEFHSHLGNFVQRIWKTPKITITAFYIFHFVWRASTSLVEFSRWYQNLQEFQSEFLRKRNSLVRLGRLGSFWSAWWNSCNWPAARDALMRKFSNCQATGGSPLLRKN